MGLTSYYEQQAIFKSIKIKYVSFVTVKVRISTVDKKVTGRCSQFYSDYLILG